MTTTWTYWAIQRPDCTSNSEGQGVIMTNDGRGIATTTGRTEGKMVESRKMRYPGAIFCSKNSINEIRKKKKELRILEVLDQVQPYRNSVKDKID